MVANDAIALGMEVTGHDPFISVDAAWGLSSSVKKASSLDTLIADSDYIGEKFDDAIDEASVRDKYKYKYGKQGKQKPKTMSDMQMRRAKKKVSEGIEDDPVLTKAFPSLKGRKFKSTVETDESGKTAGRIRKDYAQPTLKTPSPEKKSIKYKAKGGSVKRKGYANGGSVRAARF